MRDYKRERDAIIIRYHGAAPQRKPRQPARDPENPITESDYVGAPLPPNLPYHMFGDCLLWKYSLNKGGYGQLPIKGQGKQLVHRLAFLQAGETIPDGMQVNHRCNRPYCLQPGHLYAGTSAQNATDRINFNSGLNPWIAGIALTGARQDSEADRAFLEALRRDPQGREMLGSNRWKLMEPWPTPESPNQVPIEQFQCPGHDFAIPNGMQWAESERESRFCRICHEGELFADQGEGIGYSVFLSKVCPASQTVDSIYEKAVSLPLSGPEYKEWRAKVHDRGRGSLHGNHHLRECDCHFCTTDREQFNRMLQPLLDDHEKSLLITCERARGPIKEILQGFGKEAVARWSVRVEDHHNFELTAQQRQQLEQHWSTCAQAQRQVEEIVDALEKMMATIIDAGRRAQSLEDLAKNRFLQLFSMGTHYSKEHQYHWDRITRLIQRTTEDLWDTVRENMPDLLPGPDEQEPSQVQLILDDLTRYHILVNTLDFLGYQYSGNGLSTQVSPHPHADCLREVMGGAEFEDWAGIPDMTARMAQRRW